MNLLNAMEYILLFGLFPENYKSEIEKQSIGNIQYAANALQWSLVRGFDYFKKVQIINLPYVGSYPNTSKKLYMPTFKFSHIEEANDINVGFLNLQYVKHYFRYLAAKKALNKSIKDSKNIITILFYSLNSPFLKAAIDLKKKFDNVKICLIAPDLPEFMSDKMNFSYRVFRFIDSRIIDRHIHEVDSFVFLTDNMAKALQVENKPNVTIEGIFDPLISFQTSRTKQQKTILYTGTLAQRYGILYLLDAFSKISDKEYKLWICGDGDTNEIIKEAAKTDYRILFMGLKPHSEILELQQCATVLVNPRTSEGEFTKYSFPSKTMEYLASGTPTVLFKLEGIPSEYFNHCFVVEAETSEALKNKIIEVCEMDEKIRSDFGFKAKSFIFENKNPKIQCEKIIKMLDKI